MIVVFLGFTTDPDSTIKMAGKIVQTTHGVVSKDGQTLTLTTKTAAGYDVSTRVYKKQK